MNKLQMDIILSKCLNYDNINVRSSRDYTGDVIDNTFTRTKYNNLAINIFVSPYYRITVVYKYENTTYIYDIPVDKQSF